MSKNNGPVPKRSDQRRRRNKPVIPIDSVEIQDEVIVPELGVDNPHQLVADLYDSLRISGQARWYEPSDWSRARIACQLLSDLLKCGRVNGMLYAAIQRDFDSLLISEGERRRVRMEIERQKGDDSEYQAKVVRLAGYRRAAGR